MKPLLIHVHSFVDLITNSSSETFINASGSAVKSIKDLVDGMLKLTDSKLTCDDLFTIEIVYKYETTDYKTVWLSPKEAIAKFEDGTLSEDENEPDGSKYDGTYGESSIRVTPKVADDAQAKAVAGILSNLETLFDYESTYNG